MRKTNQDGVAHIGLVIALVLVVAVVAFAFWRIQMEEDTTEPEPAIPATSELERTDPIEDAAELETIEAELEATDIDAELDSAELDEVLE